MRMYYKARYGNSTAMFNIAILGRATVYMFYSTWLTINRVIVTTISMVVDANPQYGNGTPCSRWLSVIHVDDTHCKY
jgi:hypothetical protein